MNDRHCLSTVLNKVVLGSLILGMVTTRSITADTVYLKSGGKVEGIVVEENDQKVVVDLGFGKTTVERNKVERIVRSEKAENATRKSQWKKKLVLHGRFVPTRCQPLVAPLKKLERLRSETLRRKRELRRIEAGLAMTQNTTKQLDDACESISSKLKATSPRENVEKYNHLVKNLNTQVVARMEAQKQAYQFTEEIAKGNHHFPPYSNELDNYDKLAKETYQELRSSGLSKEEKAFFSQLHERLAVLKADIQTTVIRVPPRRGNHLVLNVIINKTVTTRLLLDTGASSICLSRKIADQLELNLSSAETIDACLADGTKVSAKSVLLEQVQLNDAIETNVPAVILNEPPGKNLDGLLGMSFLKHYKINLDTNAGKLTLKKLTSTH